MPKGAPSGGLSPSANKNRQAQRRSNTTPRNDTSGVSDKQGMKHQPLQHRLDMAATGRSPRKRRGGMAGPMETMGLLYEMYMGSFRA